MFAGRKKALLIVAAAVLALIMICWPLYLPEIRSEEKEEQIELPEIAVEDELTELIYNRQSQREFADTPLSRDDVGRLLWAGEGITVDGVAGPTRSSPSAGATNPLELYLLASDVEGLTPGIYHYSTRDHELTLQAEGSRGGELAAAALGQPAAGEAPAVVIIAARYERTTGRYGERGLQYVQMESGHAAQNISLMAESEGMGSVIIGAFHDDEVRNIITTEQAEPLLLIPVGYQ